MSEAISGTFAPLMLATAMGYR